MDISRSLALASLTIASVAGVIENKPIAHQGAGDAAVVFTAPVVREPVQETGSDSAAFQRHEIPDMSQQIAHLPRR